MARAAQGQQPPMRRVLDRVFEFYWGEGIADDVPALAYYLMLSLAPFALGVAAVALLVVAVVAMLWTTSGAIGVIERCLSRMLGGERHHIVLGRIRNMGLGAIVAAGVILAAIATSAVNDVPLRGVPSTTVLVVLTSLGSIVLFATIYRYAP